MFRVLLLVASIAIAGPAKGQSDWPPAGYYDKRETAGSPTPSRAALKSERATAKNPAAKTSVRAAKGKDAQAEKPLRPVLPPSSGPWRWNVTKARWSEEDERGYEEFISRIGESDCGTVHDCLTSASANPRFHHKNPPRMQFFADCADLPFVLRGYYAWQNGLPFSFSVRLASHPRIEGMRAKRWGNQVVDRYDIVGPGPDVRLALPAISQFVTSEHFRIPVGAKGKALADHYPVRISRESIRPGTVMFDVDGHLAVVHKVTEDGRVFYIDSHPDNSLTRGMFNREFARDEPTMGAVFSRWRPQTLKGAVPSRTGGLTGGRIVLTPDRELSDWSDEQLFGNEQPRPRSWEDARFVIDGQEVEYHEYVRLKLAYPGFKYDPIGETRSMVQQLCRDMRQRVDAVNLAVKAGIDKRPQPDRLPNNIYATSGDWETYSTPSRDARMKTAFDELKDEIKRFVELWDERNNKIRYTGDDLRRDLRETYLQEASACPITYIKSDGTAKQLSFEEVKRRLFQLSFDPHHCVERRWGATDADELKSCVDNPVKRAWYDAQDRLRNQMSRTYGEPMGWDLAQMRNPRLDIGVAETPDIDALKAIKEGAPDVARGE